MTNDQLKIGNRRLDTARRRNANQPKSPVVLHVTEALGGGTASALAEFVASSPGCTHHLVARVRTESAIAADLSALFATVELVPSLTQLALKTRARAKALEVDSVHLHSTWAGAVGRLSLSPSRYTLVYSPHCYFFNRQDVPGPLRMAGRLAERLLARRTSLTVCVSPYELQQATRLRSNAILVPNTSRRAAARSPLTRTDAEPLIVTTGRVCAQKDPEFLIKVVTEAQRRGVSAQWIWIGSGDPATCAALASASVRVTGWLAADQVDGYLQAAAAYLHTAAWESSPMSLLEASAVGTPLIVRSIPALVSLGLDESLTSVDRVVDEVEHVLQFGRASRPELQSAYAAAHHPDRQQEALKHAYR